MEASRKSNPGQLAEFEKSIDELRALIRAQAERLSRLESHQKERRDSIRAEGIQTTVNATQGEQRRVSRSGLFRTAAAVTAGAVGAAALGAAAPEAALAPYSGDYFTAYGGDSGYTGDSTIGFDASDVNAGFRTGVSGFGSDIGIVGESSGRPPATVNAARSTSRVAQIVVKGGAGVLGLSSHGVGVGGLTGDGQAIYGVALKGGTAIAGDATSGIGVHGVTNSNSHSALFGENEAGGEGLHATSRHGRGAVVAGGKAAIQLTPATTPSHPTRGQPGDLMVDRFHRLWFCHQGGNPARWKQIA